MTLTYDLVCLSHLRWNFVYQRPHHLLSRCARHSRVFFVEEPLPLQDGDDAARLDLTPMEDGLTLVVPRLPARVSGTASDAAQAILLRRLFATASIGPYVLWYYTPMAVGFTNGLPPPIATVYDCMDELSAFEGAPPDLRAREAVLFTRADLVFTGGRSLFQAKQRQHSSVHLFPSSVDVEHFARARISQPDPEDQSGLPHPRIGFFGVLDERLDADLLGGVARLRPEWQFVLLGPTAKIDPASLPSSSNIHYLGAKSYGQLPRYLAGWDAAIIPFARNAATRFISPTKTPEYLAAGCPVVSTSIRDVVEPYAAMGLVRIADECAAFVAALEAGIAEDPSARHARAEEFMTKMSWDKTWSAMARLIEGVIQDREITLVPAPRRVLAAAVE